MNQEDYSSSFGEGLSISGGSPVIPPESSLLRGRTRASRSFCFALRKKAGERSGGDALIQFFCQATREFFQVSGVYFWRCHFADELVGETADGKLAERFVGLRLRPDQSAVTAEAVRQRRTIFANHVKSAAFSAATEFEARSLMATPLMVFNEVIGAITFLHDSSDDFFNEDLAAKATISGGPIGEPAGSGAAERGFAGGVSSRRNPGGCRRMFCMERPMFPQ